MTDKTLGAYNIADLREIARRRVPKGIFEFIDRGPYAESPMRNNCAVFERIKFKPQALAAQADGQRPAASAGRGVRC